MMQIFWDVFGPIVDVFARYEGRKLDTPTGRALLAEVSPLLPKEIGPLVLGYPEDDPAAPCIFALSEWPPAEPGWKEFCRT